MIVIVHFKYLLSLSIFYLFKPPYRNVWRLFCLDFYPILHFNRPQNIKISFILFLLFIIVLSQYKKIYYYYNHIIFDCSALKEHNHYYSCYIGYYRIGLSSIIIKLCLVNKAKGVLGASNN